MVLFTYVYLMIVGVEKKHQRDSSHESTGSADFMLIFPHEKGTKKDTKAKKSPASLPGFPAK